MALSNIPSAQQTGGSSGVAVDLAAMLQGSSPSFARPGWTYLNIQPIPVGGPTPHLAQGTGRTNPASTDRSYGFVPGSYLAHADYQPSPFDYNPPLVVRFLRRIPMFSGYGVDGLAAMNPTYRAHDFAVAQYNQGQSRSATAWEVQSYPPNWRNLIPAQQVARYNIYNQIAAARPLTQSDYFLGYQMTQQQAQALATGGAGISPLGY